MYIKGLKLEVTLHSLHSDCKNLQKSALKSVNVQRTGKSFLQMFAFSFLKAVIFADFCLFCVPPLSLGVTLDTPQKGIHIDFQLLIFADSNFCSESRFCVWK